MLAGDDEDIGIAEARAAVRTNQEIEEAKQELEDLRGSEDDEAVYGEGAGDIAEGANVVVGQKRARDPAQNAETTALDLRKLKR